MFAGFILPAVFFFAEFAPVINYTVSASAYVFLKSAVIQSVHFAVSVIGIAEKPVPYFYYTLISGRVMEFNFLQFVSE